MNVPELNNTRLYDDCTTKFSVIISIVINHKLQFSICLGLLIRGQWNILRMLICIGAHVAQILPLSCSPFLCQLLIVLIIKTPYLLILKYQGPTLLIGHKNSYIFPTLTDVHTCTFLSAILAYFWLAHVKRFFKLISDYCEHWSQRFVHPTWRRADGSGLIGNFWLLHFRWSKYLRLGLHTI